MVDLEFYASEGWPDNSEILLIGPGGRPFSAIVTPIGGGDQRVLDFIQGRIGESVGPAEALPVGDPFETPSP